METVTLAKIGIAVVAAVGWVWALIAAQAAYARTRTHEEVLRNLITWNSLLNDYTNLIMERHVLEHHAPTCLCDGCDEPLCECDEDDREIERYIV